MEGESGREGEKEGEGRVGERERERKRGRKEREETSSYTTLFIWKYDTFVGVFEIWLWINLITPSGYVISC